MYSDLGLVLGVVVVVVMMVLVVLAMGDEAAAEDTRVSSYAKLLLLLLLLLGMRRDNVSVVGWVTALAEGEMMRRMPLAVEVVEVLVIVISSLPHSVPWSFSLRVDFFLDSLRMEEQSCARHARLVVEDTELVLLVE